jgi:hypothetical protein
MLQSLGFAATRLFLLRHPSSVSPEKNESCGGFDGYERGCFAVGLAEATAGERTTSPGTQSPARRFAERPLIWIATINCDPNICKYPPDLDRDYQSRSEYIHVAPDWNRKFMKFPFSWLCLAPVISSSGACAAGRRGHLRLAAHPDFHFASTGSSDSRPAPVQDGKFSGQRRSAKACPISPAAKKKPIERVSTLICVCPPANSLLDVVVTT